MFILTTPKQFPGPLRASQAVKNLNHGNLTLFGPIVVLILSILLAPTYMVQMR